MGSLLLQSGLIQFYLASAAVLWILLFTDYFRNHSASRNALRHNGRPLERSPSPLAIAAALQGEHSARSRRVKRAA